jgi:hypothetical protein
MKGSIIEREAKVGCMPEVERLEGENRYSEAGFVESSFASDGGAEIF